MTRASDVMAKLLGEFHEREKARIEKPSDEDVSTTLQRMVEDGYQIGYDPEACMKLAKWLAAERNGIAKRGLLLTGAPGNGKTLFMSRFVRADRMFTASQIVDFWKQLGYGQGFSEAVHGIYVEGRCSIPACSVVVDDVGQEPVGVAFGSREEVMERFVTDRYAIWDRGGAKTHMTSNLDPRQMNARYGARVMDRLGEMMYHVAFNGKSVRTSGIV